MRPMPLPWSRDWRSAPRRTRTRVVQRPGRLCHDHPPLAVRARRCARAIYPSGKAARTLVDTTFTGDCAIYGDAALALGGSMATPERSSSVRNEAARDGAAAYRGLRVHSCRSMRHGASPTRRATSGTRLHDQPCIADASDQRHGDEEPVPGQQGSRRREHLQPRRGYLALADTEYPRGSLYRPKS